MTPQEQQLLNSLAERVNSTHLEEKDPDAEAFLNRSFNPNPDALYILAQTVLVQNIAIEQAKAQIAQLQLQAQQARQPAHATSFLGNLLGHRDPEPAPPPQANVAPAYPPPVRTQYVETSYQPAQQGPYQSVPQQYVPTGSAQPSFLRGAMQTAAGVAAGALAFEGVESVLHGLSGHPGYGWGEPAMGMGGFGMGGGMERPVDETVINNYYDQAAGEQRFNESADRGESGNRGDAQFSDASYNTGDDSNQGFDDSTQDDNSNFDDSDLNDDGGFDDGGGDNLV